MRLMQEVVECWLARLRAIQPMPRRDELLAPAPSGHGVPAAALDQPTGGLQDRSRADSDEADPASLSKRLDPLGLRALLDRCPAAEPDLAMLARSAIALKEVAKCAERSGAEVAAIRELHQQMLPLSVQLVSAQFYVTIDRIRSVHGTVLPVGDAFDAASGLARELSGGVLGRSDSVEAIREGTSFDESRMVLAPGHSIRGAGRVSPRTFGIRAGGSAAHPRKAIVVSEGAGT